MKKQYIQRRLESKNKGSIKKSKSLMYVIAYIVSLGANANAQGGELPQQVVELSVMKNETVASIKSQIARALNENGDKKVRKEQLTVFYSDKEGKKCRAEDQ